MRRGRRTSTGGRNSGTGSWIHCSGTPEAGKVSQSYAIQRYMTACAGRGAQPIKFNGSLFTVGHDLPDGKAQPRTIMILITGRGAIHSGTRIPG